MRQRSLGRDTQPYDALKYPAWNYPDHDQHGHRGVCRGDHETAG